MRNIATIICILAASWLLTACAKQTLGEGIFKYTDERGVVHYTNVPTDGRSKEVEFGSAASIGRRALRSDGTYRSDYDHHIQHAARIHRVDPMLVKAVIKTESDFDRYALSPKGAQGLMQLMPDTARYLRVNDPFDPWQNIYGGTRYLREMLDNFNGDLSLSLAAYNAGPTRVMQSGGIPSIPETIDYVSKVLRQYRAYQQTDNYFPVSATSIRVREMVTVN